MTEAERDLLECFREGDPDAFQEIVLRFQDPLMGFFFRLCWDRYQAEDLVQEVFVRLVRSCGTYQAEGRLDTFVFRIARNLWIDQIRRRACRPGTFSLDQPWSQEDEEPAAGRVAGEAPGPPEQVVAKEEKRLLREAWNRLPDGHRIVFELAVYQELPYREIASVLEIPVGTVKSRMFHALKQLREQLAPREGREGA